jgi:hypothetical protein
MYSAVAATAASRRGCDQWRSTIADIDIAVAIIHGGVCVCASVDVAVAVAVACVRFLVHDACQ